MASSFDHAIFQKQGESASAVELAELAELIETLPEEYQGRFRAALRRSAANLDRRRRILNFIQEALAQLRLDMKFLLFDLEATRKERDRYRRELEESR